MFAIEANNELTNSVSPGNAIIVGDVRYPYAMLANMTADQRAELGVVEVIIDPYPPDLDVDVTENAPAKIAGVWRITHSTTPRAFDVTTAQDAECKIIDRAAEQCRLAFITGGSGQALTYSRKLEEATKLMALPEGAEVNDEDFPFLTSSIGVDGDTVESVAETVLANNELWTAVGSAIERIRLNAKAKTKTKSTRTTVSLARNTVTAAFTTIATSGGDPTVITNAVTEALTAFAGI